MRTRPLPSPPGRFLTGHFADLTADWLGTLTRYARAHGDLQLLRFGPMRVVFVNRPEWIDEVFADRGKRFHKSSFAGLARPLVGNGLLLSEGDFWRHQRRMLQPSFHREALASYASIMVDETERLLERWRAGGVRDVYPDATRLALDIVGRALFDVDVDGDAMAVGEAMNAAMAGLTARMNSRFPLPYALPTPSVLRLRRGVAAVDALVYRAIARRRGAARAGAAPRRDLLSLLLEARDADDGTGMSDAQVRDEAVTLLVAGFETTAIALSWALWLIAGHPEVGERLAAEADAVLADRPATAADLARLTFTGWVVHETLRLYPPAWAVGRAAIADVELGGYRVRKGDNVLIAPWVTHRDPRHFEEPARFLPERWDGERLRTLPRGTYMPYGGGPRVCIGQAFAHMELVLALATIARRVRLDPVPGATVRPAARFTLRPEPGALVRVRARPGS